LTARARGQRDGQPAAPTWAISTVTVGSMDVNDVRLALQPALTVAGRVVFDATSRRAPEAGAVRVRLMPIEGDQRLAFAASGDVAPDGKFVIANVMPGRYLAHLYIGLGEPEPAWTIRTLTVGDRSLTDLPLEVPAGGQIDDLAITATDRVTALRGSLLTAANQPAPEFYVIAFPVDRAYWLPGSRRVQAVRPATDGAFLFKSLSPGEYFLAALTDVEDEEWHDAAFLEQLVAASIKVKIAEGTTTLQNVRIGR
jgi:hypothetical protein